MMDVQLLAADLDVAKCIQFVSSPDAGGINVFIGTVRSQTNGKKVQQLEFEAYEPMAVSEMKKIARRAMEKYDVQKIAIHHRVGKLNIGEIPVVIAVSASHRDAAFMACRFAIDSLKESVPIWKKEFFEDGAIWVAAHP